MASRKVGRPSDYDPDEHPKAVRALAAKWMPKTEIAETLSIDRATLDRWIEAHPELAAAHALGRKDATDHVERSLFARANGYSHPSEKIVVVSGGQGMGSSVERVETVEHYPPDATALKFWLSNRRPEEWREKVEHNHEGNVRLIVDTGVPRPPPEPSEGHNSG